jgi:hypothetical protein
MEDLRRSYVKILVIEAVIILALWWFGQRYS